MTQVAPGWVCACGLLRARAPERFYPGRQGVDVSHRRIARAFTLAGAASAVILAAVVPAVAGTGRPTASPAPTHAPLSRIEATATAAPKVFAYYYLWWSIQHWHDKLGANYPYSASPLPLPATANSDGCSPVSRYAGNQLTDVPTTLPDQDTPGVIEDDVRQAAAAHLTGFVVNWIGTGTASQTPDSVSYSVRLAAVVAAVHKVNAEGTPFQLLLSLKSSATVLSTSWIVNDMDYLARTYGNDSAFDHSFSPSRLPIIWTGSRKYPSANLATVASAVRSRIQLLGDETSASWNASRAASLDGDSYYWSSQDPVKNPQSFAQLRTLASTVRASGVNPDGSAKVWLAPLTPGFNPKLLTGSSTCVARRGGQSLIDVYKGNSTTSPSAYTLISWNEISEGSYIKPMQRYGSASVDAVAKIMSGTV